jgi:hypothetical protein
VVLAVEVAETDGLDGPVRKLVGAGQCPPPAGSLFGHGMISWNGALGGIGWNLQGRHASKSGATARLAI